MKKLLQRRWRTPFGCFSDVESADGALKLKTVEQPWKPWPGKPHGTPFHSCVPVGTYRLIRDHRPQHGDCFCMINEALGIYRYPNPGGRDSCLWHIANSPWEVEGCEGPGLTWNAHLCGVSSSAKAMRQLNAWFGDDDEVELVITWHQPEDE